MYGCIVLKLWHQNSNYCGNFTMLFCRRRHGLVHKCVLHVQHASLGPNSHISMTGGGGGEDRQRFILIPQKIPTSQFVYPKKSLLFIAYPKKNPSEFLHEQILLFIFWNAKTCQLQLWFWSKTKLYKTNTKSSHDCYIVSLHPHSVSMEALNYVIPIEYFSLD